MPKAGDLKWDEFFKANEPKSDLKKTDKEKVPAAQYHQDKPVGTPNKNAFSGPSEEELKKRKPAQQVNKPGEVPRKPMNVEIARAILANMPKQMRQPTHAEMVAAAKQMGLQQTPEQMQELQKTWENTFNDFYTEAKKNIEPENYQDESGWGKGGSFNDGLSPEELEKRNKFHSGNENE